MSIRTDEFIPYHSTNIAPIVEAVTEFVFEKVAPSVQPNFIEDFVKRIHEKRVQMANDYQKPIKLYEKDNANL
jgi:hypothetical protein